MTIEINAQALRTARLQAWRRRTQTAFFALFLVAPALNLLRFDLHETQLWFLGMRWSLGIDALAHGEVSATQAALTLLLRAFLPALLLIAVFLGLAYRYGRIYCGWLCPHFSAVESLNTLLHRACGKLSLWDASTTQRAGVEPSARWWPLFALSCLTMGFVWAITLLTYLLPPAEIWGGLLRGELASGPARFLWVASAVFTLEFAFARHLFCRFGCAVGLFQSLVWMANPRGMVVAFSRERARDCKSCRHETADGGVLPGTAALTALPGNACDAVCPMRLRPRNIKRLMFSCVQCGQCLTACDTTQTAQQRSPSLQWEIGEAALRETLRQRREELQEKR
jgi:polyferredoxin